MIVYIYTFINARYFFDRIILSATGKCSRIVNRIIRAQKLAERKNKCVRDTQIST